MDDATARPGLGRFSLSLAVADLDASLAFYEALGFGVVDGGHVSAELPDSVQTRWRILRNGDTLLGLFQGMFPRNLLTFHPGDVRAIQRQLDAAGVEVLTRADEQDDGPLHVMLEDPDGNPIMLDQDAGGAA